MTTIIRIKYIESSSNNDDVEHSDATSVEKEVLVNINCPIRMILNYIRKATHVKGEYDLCVETTYHLRNVSFYEPCTRGIDILQPDLIYVIITFDRDENGQMTNLAPLLTGKAAKRINDVLWKTRKPNQTRNAKNSNAKSKKRNNAQQA